MEFESILGAGFLFITFNVLHMVITHVGKRNFLILLVPNTQFLDLRFQDFKRFQEECSYKIRK